MSSYSNLNVLNSGNMFPRLIMFGVSINVNANKSIFIPNSVCLALDSGDAHSYLGERSPFDCVAQIAIHAHYVR